MAQEVRPPVSGVADIERELVTFARRVRSFHAKIAAQVHPDLEPAVYGLMGVIYDAGPLRGSELVERLGLDKSTVSRQVAQLVALGMAERVADPEDGRARVVRLTDRGADQIQQLREERHRRLQERLGHWSEQELHDLAGCLRRLNGML
ncbi:MAG TPA: MarR family transcriptional regulator [Pseudonocardiaceae bacterium]|jgi:DNA-binding MarR family transcriptional regulator